MPIKGVLLFAVLACSLPACFFSPFYGILVWQVIAYLNPQSSLFYWSAAVNFPWALAVAIPTLGGMVFFVRDWVKRLAAREIYLMLVLWIWFMITSTLSSQNSLFVHHSQDTWDRLWLVSKILFMTLVIVAIVNSLERLRIMILVICGCFSYFVLKDFPFILMTGGVFRIYGPDHSMIADNNDFGLALNMTLPLFLLLAKTEPKRLVRWFWGFVFTIGIPVVFFTYSRGAMVGLVVVLLLMLLQLKQRFLIAPVLVAAAILMLTYAPPSWKERMNPTRPDAVDGSAQERLNAWAFARNLADEYPLTGGGFATFTPELFGRYAPKGNDIHGPHSIYFQVLAEHGYPGLFLYLSLVLSCFLTLWKTAKMARRIGDSMIFEYCRMLRFSFVAFLGSGTFLGRAYFDYIFTMVACVVILHIAAREKLRQQLGEVDEAGEELVGDEILAPSGAGL